MEFKDYYKILDVPRDASQDDIRKAYRKLARKYHPDVSKEADAEARMRDVNEANDVLRDAEKRAAYDQLASGVTGGKGGMPPPGWDRGFEFSGAGGGANEAQFHDFMEGLFKQAARQRHGGASGYDGAGPGGQAGARTFRMRGEDHHADIEISLEDSFNGVTRELSLRSVQLNAQGQPHLATRTLSVRIPTGIREGQMIRLAGQGMPGEGGGESGDLFLAFSTANEDAVRQHEGLVTTEFVGEAAMSRFYEATIQAVEEAIMNSMFANETMTGINGFTVRALPIPEVQEILKRYNRLVPVD